MENYLIDNLDRGILEALMGNARTAYAELAKQFGVSPDDCAFESRNEAGGDHYQRIDVSRSSSVITADPCGIILKSAKATLPRWQSWKALMKSLKPITQPGLTASL